MADLGSDVPQISDGDLAADDDFRIPGRKSAVPGWLYATVSQIAVKVGSLLFGDLTGQAGKAVIVNEYENGFDFGDPGGGGGGGTANVVAKAKVEFASNGDITLVGAENVASVTRTGTGLYDIVFTDAIPAGCVGNLSGRFNDGPSSHVGLVPTFDPHDDNEISTAGFSLVVWQVGTSGGPYDPYVDATDGGWLYFEIKDPTVDLIGGGGGGSGEPITPPTMQFGSVVIVNDSHIDVNLPAGAVAGDPCFVWYHGGNGPVPPADWIVLKHIENGGWNGILMWKPELDGTDISNGYIRCPFTGGFVNNAACWTYDAATFGGIEYADIGQEYSYAYGTAGVRIGIPKRLPAGVQAMIGTTCRANDAPTSVDGTSLGQVVDNNGSMTVFDAPITGIVGANIDIDTTVGSTGYIVLRFVARGI